MDKATHELDSAETQVLNARRLHEGVTLLSDVTTPDEMSMRRDVISRGKPMDSHKGLMPCQDLPSKTSWTKTLLHCPLFQWSQTGEKLHRKWQSCCDKRADTVCLLKDEEREIMTKDGNGCAHAKETSAKSPAAAMPVGLESGKGSIKRKRVRNMLKMPECEPEFDFTACVEKLPNWEREIVENAAVDNMFLAAEKLNDESSQVISASNSSAPNFVGAFGWVAKVNGECIAENDGPSPGHRSTSFRAEACGLLSFCTFVCHAGKCTETQCQGNFSLCSDAKSMLDKIADVQTWTHDHASANMTGDWDVLQAIVNVLERFDASHKLEHVKGCQDDVVACKDLSLPAQLNVDADELAGKFKHKHRQSKTECHLIKGSNVHSMAGSITNWHTSNIRKIWTLPEIKKKICEKKESANDEWEAADWVAHGISLRDAHD